MRTVHLITLVPVACCAIAAADDSKPPAVTLQVHVRERGSDAPLPCRAWVQMGDQRFFTPAAHGATPYKRDRSFSCDGDFEIALPPGEAVIHVERGSEYVPQDLPITLTPDEPARLNVELSRWINMNEEGWYSADMHVHFGRGAPHIIEQLARADDVNVVPMLTYWNEWQPQWPAAAAGRTISLPGQRLITLGNQEIERIGGGPYESVGALLIFGLRQPVYVPDATRTSPPDAMLARLAREMSPDCVIDTDKPVWGENVVGVALGLFDSVQVCHNHYHRDDTMPVCCGMADSDIEPRAVPAEDELFWRTNLTWYRWLNCGFRLTATGGSAIGVMPVPLGYNRTYARVTGVLNESNYLAAIRAGKTFATSGPMLSLTVSGQGPGGTVNYAGGTAPLPVAMRVRSIQPLEVLELIVNGEVVDRSELSRVKPAPVLDERVNTSLSPKRSGWVAARALFRAPDRRLRQAHTSPVYVTVNGKPTASRRDAEFFLAWLERLEAVAAGPERYASDDQRDEALALFREAGQVYQGIIQTATDTWGD